MTAGKVAAYAVVVGRALHQQQHQLEVVAGQLTADAEQLFGEERVGEDLGLRLRDDARDRSGAPGDEGAGAAWFGTYPSSSTAHRTFSTRASRTPLPPLTTRETPARSATAPRVGRDAEIWSDKERFFRDGNNLVPRE
ncbi:hypothetical protein RKD20_002876 [Streptomyces sp. SLBN-8D4]